VLEARRTRAPCFMDEIANLPLAQQAKILRLWRRRHYEKLGSSHNPAGQHPLHSPPTPISTAWWRNALPADLLYRLNGVTLHIPHSGTGKPTFGRWPRVFCTRHANTNNSSPARGFSAAALRARESYGAGNILELQHGG